MSRRFRGFILLAFTASSFACERAAEVLHIPPRHGCSLRREVTYCVTAWDRDSWNERSRAAIGEAAQAWNQVGPYQFREVYCNAPHALPIFFERGAHASGHPHMEWGAELAHAAFPDSSQLLIHFKNDLAWWQASDTLGLGFDMRTVALHEMGHVLGLDHDEGGDSIMTPYVVRHTPLGSDIARVRSYGHRCGIEAPPAIEITEPRPGATWHRGQTYTLAWRAPTLAGQVLVDIRHQSEPPWRVWDGAPVSGQMQVTVNDNWPLGCPYEVCVWHPDTGQICSSMILVAP